MPVIEEHPNITDLEAFALGTLDNASVASVEAHVAGCPTCQERAAAASGDTLVELLRRAHAQMGRRTDTVAEVARVQISAPVPARTEEDVFARASPSVSAGTEALVSVPEELARHERYRVVRLLGEGGMGSVYEAEHRVMQRSVALKVINRAYTTRPAAVERFRREVRAAARLSHPNIVTTYDAEDAGDTHFLVMEYVEGISLGRLVKELGPLLVAEACEYIRQAALGLQHAHERGMVHRDVKPDNLILVASPVASAPGVVKVLDFGLAALTAERGGGLTDTNVVMGTPDYMAPEQAEDPRTADIRADVYSLGCTLYYLLTGKVPYPAPTSLLKVLAHRERPVPSVRQVRPDVPAELARVPARLLAKKPEDRYQTPREVAAALEAFTKQRPVDSSDTVALQRRGESLHRLRRRLLVAELAALLLVGVTVAGVSVYRIQTDKGELVITTESDDVEVIIKQGGEVVRVIDTKTNKSITLRSGNYELELKGAPKGLKLNIDKATLTRGETVLAKIERVAKPKPAAEVKVGEIRRFGAENHRVIRLALSPDGRRVLTASADGTARYWDIATGKEIHRLPGEAGEVYGAAVSPDGAKLLTCGDDRLIHVWDAATGKELKQLKGHTTTVTGVAFSPDGQQVVSASWDLTVRLWNLDSGELTSTLEGHTDGLQGAVFSPDGKRVASWAFDKTVRLWDVKDRKEIRCLQGHTEMVRAAAFSPDGSRLLSGSYAAGGKGSLNLWEVPTGKLLLTIGDIPGGVHGLAISADGQRALSGGPAGLVQYWDLGSGKEIIVLKGHDVATNVGDVVFLPRGHTALSVGSDATIRLWRLPDPPAAKDKP
jgi:eukaryotic-like serine/threonine-protein kinase